MTLPCGIYPLISTHLSFDYDVSDTANNTNSIAKTDSLSNACPWLECMTKEDIIAQLHHPGTTLPPICPRNCPNRSNTKSSWTPEKLHWITGCPCFRNYCHITKASNVGHLINTVKFLISLGLYTTISKAPSGKAIDQMLSYYLDIVHVDIAFGDCASIAGYK